ncbi:hypothetical protein [Nostoc sp. FACHB-888]|uniref:hypothetical protein n=1 Tax=Nostoc sp. FACHB-888 TaxID=2692842 RepID=UPI001681D18A|nr:hypothetical protein [Nostoc sp. FACHB-888]MBD2246750.1 hypothetical protein [Nostoc sp. FACHB-888]MCC5648838.1 hypothetical protein [Nostoc sp. XA013]
MLEDEYEPIEGRISASEVWIASAKGVVYRRRHRIIQQPNIKRDRKPVKPLHIR